MENLLQVSSGQSPPRETPVADFWTQIRSKIRELIKDAFESMLSDSSTNKSIIHQSYNKNISISRDSTIENTGENLCRKD